MKNKKATERQISAECCNFFKIKQRYVDVFNLSAEGRKLFPDKGNVFRTYFLRHVAQDGRIFIGTKGDPVRRGIVIIFKDVYILFKNISTHLQLPIRVHQLRYL